MLTSTAMQECPASPLLWSMAIFMEQPQQRKGRSVDALKKAGEHPAVIVAVARLFWGERKIEKTRQWMQNAITADADYGDAWGWWLKFERQHGEQVRRFYSPRVPSTRADKVVQERQEAVIAKCQAAAPHHGPVWQAVAKDLGNGGLSTRDILGLVADRLE
jgi:pre-mRNA-processing factor 6